VIVIRPAQMATFASARRRQALLDACAYLRRQFHAALWDVPERELQGHVGAALAQAGRYGLHSERDHYRYLNLCMFYGWDFDRRPGNAWMRGILDQAAAGPAPARLHRLVSHCIERRAIDAANQALARAQGGRDDGADHASGLDTLLPGPCGEVARDE
jgi:hypothetical protein